MRVYGLTGGIGSGKSAAAARFRERGIPAIDADAVGHRVLEPGGAAEASVIEAFGDDIVVDGRIDRERLAAKVFGNAQRLAQLNGIVHPRIGMEIAQWCAEQAGGGAAAVLVDAALIAEGGKLEPWLNGLVLVSAPLETRIERLRTGRGIDVDEAHRRIAAQTDPESKRALAHWVIDNSGSHAALCEQVDGIAAALLQAQDR